MKALEKESMPDLRLRLERLWNRKAYKFAARGADVFGSEYPFDTTGFESTHALAKRALKLAKPASAWRIGRSALRRRLPSWRRRCAATCPAAAKWK